MLKYNKNSEQINPWTFRHRETSREFNDSSHHQANVAGSLGKGQNGERRSRAQHTLHFNRNRIGTELKPVITQISERTFCNKIPTLSLEGQAIAQIEKMSPSYKFISFQYRFKPLKKRAKERRLPNASLSLKQYTQGMEVASKREEKLPKEYEKVLKVKRYFTEEKDYEDQRVSSQRKHSENELVQASKTEELRKVAGVKIVKICKGIHSKQEILTKGRLYDQIQTIYDRKGKNSGGHLSQMKRNYNIKKLQRLIKQENT